MQIDRIGRVGNGRNHGAIACRRNLIDVTQDSKLSPMVRFQFRLREEERDQLRLLARQSGASVAELVREAVRRTWARSGQGGPVAIWDGEASQSAVQHDALYDDP